MKLDPLTEALQVLRDGGLILYPTDTIWGIGCDATNTEAVERIYRLKGRASDKSVIVLLDQEHKLASYVREVPEVAYQLIAYTEKPLTIVYPNAKNLAENALADDGSIGIRIVDHPFCARLIQRFRKPIVSTSANLSGAPSPKDFAEIDEEIKLGVDYIVPELEDTQRGRQASTIIKLGLSGQYKLIRK